MKLFFLFFLILCPFVLQAQSADFFKGTDTTESHEVEATSLTPSLRSSDACCDREYVSEWAQDMSKEESQRVVNKWLAPSRKKINPYLPHSGQR